jgi:putative heme utilization carrier protein HutX
MLAPDKLASVRAALAARPDGVLEEVAREHGVSLQAVLDCLDPANATAAPGSQFQEIWSDLTGWGSVTFIVHTDDGVFEVKTAVPPGSEGRGYFNVHSDAPLGGHIKASRCDSIYFVDRPFFGRRSCSVQFMNQDGGAMFKVFVGRDANRELDAGQVARFESLRNRLAPPGR